MLERVSGSSGATNLQVVEPVFALPPVSVKDPGHSGEMVHSTGVTGDAHWIGALNALQIVHCVPGATTASRNDQGCGHCYGSRLHDRPSAPSTDSP